MGNIDFKAIVRNYTDATTTNDPDAIRAMYTDDFKLYHNFTRIELPLERSIDYFNGLRNVCRTAELEIVRLVATPHGVIREQWARGETKDGTPYVVPYICHFQINRDGKIYRIDEFLDSAAFQPMYDAGWTHDGQR